MNNTGFQRIIPTPQHIIPFDQPSRIYRRDMIYPICLIGPAGDKLQFAADFLCREAMKKFNLQLEIKEIPDANTIILCSDYSLLENQCLDADSLTVFDNDLGRQQGYIIKSCSDEPVLLCAASEPGCLYAVSTLLQLLHAEEDDILLDCQVIADYPDFRYRGNCWLFIAEWGMWSYDRGDGADAFRDRIVEKLDMCVLYKVNMVLFEGFGWSTDKFPGYADLMRELNKEARLRGIHLMSAGYGAGYCSSGRGIYKGEVFMNRLSYPDGKEYPCLGGIGDDDANEIGRFHGTCLTNTELTRLKCEELHSFVEKVQPGAMYIHSLDNDKVSKNMWIKRCPECRKRWPNDDVTAADGMAGAYADFYDTLAECIKSVSEADYDADKDCVIYMVSPGYTGYEHTDEEMRTAMDYWAAVSRLMKHKQNVSFMFREHFYNHDDDHLRCAQYKEYLDTNGGGHDFSVIYFFGADGFHNDQLLLSNPSCYYMFKGAGSVIPACGHSYQEPFQLLNAEYLWNSEGSAFYKPDNIPTNYKDFLQFHKDMMDAKIRPEALYSDEGFLGTACRKLYGEIAGPVMAEMFAMRGENNEPPVPFVANVELGTGGFCPLGQLKYRIDLNLQAITQTREKLQQVYNVTVQARDLVNSILEKLSINDPVRTEIKWYGESLEMGARYAKHCLDYVVIYKQLLDHFELNEDFGDTSQKIEDLRDDLRETQQIVETSSLKAMDYFAGALGGRKETLLILEDNLVEMKASIAQNKRFTNVQEEYLPCW